MFEVFNTVTGSTFCYATTKVEAKRLCNTYHGCDYDLSNAGFYCVKTREGREQVMQRFNNRGDATRYCDMNNQADDYATYSVRHIA